MFISNQYYMANEAQEMIKNKLSTLKKDLKTYKTKILE